MDRSWLARHPAEVAYELIGCHLTVMRDGEIATGRIVETEAYAGPMDAASHSARLTVGKDVMSRQPGTIYVYRSYGIHTCMNIVSHEDGAEGGILIRAVEPVEGIDLMYRRRGEVPERQLGRGPGNVGQALGVLLTDIGDDLFDGDTFRLEAGIVPGEVWASARIGISKAVDHPWRFFDPHSRSVSAHRRGEPVDLDGIAADIRAWQASFS